ncbi:flagellar motor protein MotS [Cytobacillus gottheilii]|uniref:Flagellar motor protein MotB n=1 Tax=Cytobacillus gottheilii TaxID=859144 RepID=A0ABX8FAX5_9BACI|nr:flagellar motor protein MotS [Cytobacillus gottheilii]QVY60707.1 flagellar motor protein MotB [Cytobacillus gottheilii]
MNVKKRGPKPKKGAPTWMVTFSDLVTLILVFFILLFSMSQIDVSKFQAIAESFRTREILDFYPSVIENQHPGEAKDSDEDVSSSSEEGTLDHLLTEVQVYLQENGMEDVIVANRTERGVVLVLQEQILFETGDADLKEQSFPFLNKVATMLSEMHNLVKVEGHTDSRPITTYRYPSNWELSAARSASVIRYLVESQQLDSSRFAAVGYGDTRPVAVNDSPENLSKNRRVEIIISDPAYNEEIQEEQ